MHRVSVRPEIVERVLARRGRVDIDAVLVAGTKTNVCCECTARDAMMLNFETVMQSDCSAALSDDEHRAALENIFQQFGDVSTTSDVLRKLTAGNT
jgi:ureidoacrylate peracid hydrolase